MHTRPLTQDDLPELEALLNHEPTRNPFHLSNYVEYGLGAPVDSRPRPWAIGAYRDEALTGVVTAFRGTGGVFHTPGDTETVQALSEVVAQQAASGHLTLLSGHSTQIEPFLPSVGGLGAGAYDRCYFRTLFPGDLQMADLVPGFDLPRLATNADMERLIDFYQVGFYSLAHLPTRAAWRSRLTEQMAFRSIYFIPDREGAVASAAMSSAEGKSAAMIGGVATLGVYRKRGLSALCVAALCNYLFRKGMTSISLFYIRDNYAAAHVYDRLGFRHDGEWLLVPLGFGAAFGPLFGAGQSPSQT